MRLTARLLSTPVTPQNLLSKNTLALLPPIPLYRRILRAHRHLPAEQRALGDHYVRDEWRKHKDVENPVHIIAFLTEWQLYAQHLEGETWRDAKLDMSKLDKMSDDQIGQLYELMKKARNEDDDSSS
ncbi:acetate non-utilizing protein 9 [Orbilia oligospora]|uniref:Succinate dehydrogenase assembly factor 3 n=1 Tax=Orbilia oligospora TaxID=2813651 RepID=A0A6G1M7B2_ORBOL|nr:acetate non-utilizing protein 9 [Orbilia oligospora]KAF3209277.1 acetate non-utilizing protein 9 [Orbilia oligospora]KAF3210594.1 acetate non-utilizing protein 9 [Orbilia oligospora]KAF3231060.1 acetate non-utilizing protein 9 [Orbilia oligospora]KAF3247938.1 acetate non-utilizing protein 9 [Orbilia oligospora]